MNKLEKLFNPSSVVVIGASEETGKIGNIISKNLLELGYSGKVYFVNPKHEKLFNQDCYKKLSEIEDGVDLAIVAVPAKFVNEVIQDGANKIKNYVIISAGFSEIGEDGLKQEKELNKLAKSNQLNILGPNCLGFINPEMKLNASFGSGMTKEGNISFVSQSGALISALMDISIKESIGFSQIVSVGNKMDVDEVSMLEFLANDEKIKVIGMYLEGIKNGPDFISVVKKVSKIKPVVILKSGKTKKAQKAIFSHTGALAGSDEIMDAVFEKCGVIRAGDLEDFFGLLKLISNSKSDPDEKVVVLTNAGGVGVLTTDAFQNKEIKLGEISDEVKSELKSFLPAESSVENPIDLLGDTFEDRYQKTLEILEKQDKIKTIIAVLTPQNQTPVLKIAQALVQFKDKSQKNIVAVFVGGEKIDEALRILHENKVTVFSSPERAVNALNQYYFWKQKNDQGIVAEKIEINEERKEKALEIIKKAKEENREALLFNEASQIFNLYQIPCCKSWMINSGEDPVGDFNFPVVAKIDSDKVLHKSDQEALILNLKNEEDLNEATEKLSKNFPGEKIIIQEMIEKGAEIILGIKKDPIFGPVIIFGLGGIYTEVFQMIDLLILPSSREEISKRLMQSKIKFFFQGERGQKSYNLDEMTDILVRLQNLALEISEIKELDVNPLFIYNDGKSVLAVDIKIIF